MDKNYIQGLISGIAIMVVVGALYIGADRLVTYFNDNGIYFEQTDNRELDIDEKVNKIMRFIERFYYQEVDLEALVEGAYKGMLAGVGDPYTTYYTEAQFKDIMESTEGVYSGIGSYISYDPIEKTFKLLPFAGGPSDKAGVLPGDILLKVDGTDITNKELEETVSMVKGEKGTKVVLTVYREFEDRMLEIPIVRDKIDVPTVAHEMLENNIGYVQITQFDEVTYNQFMNAYEDLERQGQEGMIIDVRNNPGGLLHIVKAISDELLPQGLIVYTEDKYGKREELKSSGAKQFKKPLVVLINGNSASASEILAGAIKDHNVGTLVGTTTFGKGLVQRILELGDGTAIKLTISKYFTPAGNYIHDKGIDPHIVVELPEELKNRLVINREDDIQLQKALEIIIEALK